ncbi:hypothetical protein pb186bvf_003416 [Paramecium bursaria]
MNYEDIKFSKNSRTQNISEQKIDFAKHLSIYECQKYLFFSYSYINFLNSEFWDLSINGQAKNQTKYLIQTQKFPFLPYNVIVTFLSLSSDENYAQQYFNNSVIPWREDILRFDVEEMVISNKKQIIITK